MKKIVKTIFLLIFISFVGCKINALELTKPGSRIYSINDGETIIEDNAYNFTFVDMILEKIYWKIFITGKAYYIIIFHVLLKYIIYFDFYC